MIEQVAFVIGCFGVMGGLITIVALGLYWMFGDD